MTIFVVAFLIVYVILRAPGYVLLLALLIAALAH
jgi:hypothetical protein